MKRPEPERTTEIYTGEWNALGQGRPDRINRPGLPDDAEGNDIARRLEHEHPNWVVVFGAYSRQFTCLPGFAGQMITASYPNAAAERMAQEERHYSAREGVRYAGGNRGQSL